MKTPSDLEMAIASLPADPRFELVGNWMERGEGRWSFQFRARLSVAPSEHVPEWSCWHVVVAGSAIDREVRIYPDASDGIVATFPHQDFNGGPIDGLPWRMEKPCLERSVSVFQRDGWSGEPTELSERFVWRIGRLFAWIDAAAEDRLLMDGDPAELPAQPNEELFAVLGFRESIEDLEWWGGNSHRWGFATLSGIPGARSAGVIADFMDSQRRSLKKPFWTSEIPVGATSVDAVWVVLPQMPVFAPWRAAATWFELTELCAGVSVDLPAILAEAGARLRHIERPKEPAPTHLLLGFPLAETMGEVPQRLHWIAVRNMQLCKRDAVRNGFRTNTSARRVWDSDFAKSSRPLQWLRTANWAPDQLRKRGEAEDTVRSKSILLLGCGTLGAAVAENLLRMGVTRMGVVDFDTMGVGNLCRHSLTLADVGHNKATRLAKRLNMAAPDAHVIALPYFFSASDPDLIEPFKEWDVVIDCTASDTVSKEMAAFAWKTERLFVSLSMTWRAKGLFAFAASETAFPAIDAMERFIAASPEPEVEAVGAMEGIGCWHPIFPATSDDVTLWAAIGSKFVRTAILERKKTASLYVLRQDASVDRIDA